MIFESDNGLKSKFEILKKKLIRSDLNAFDSLKKKCKLSNDLVLTENLSRKQLVAIKC